VVAVLRLLRGEGVEPVSRSVGVSQATLNAWRYTFLRAGEAALARLPEIGHEPETRDQVA